MHLICKVILKWFVATYVRSELEREWIDLENKRCSEFEAQGSNFQI